MITYRMSKCGATHLNTGKLQVFYNYGQYRCTDRYFYFILYFIILDYVFHLQGIMEASFGLPGYVILSIIQFVYPFIAMVSYNIICGDTLTKLLVSDNCSNYPLMILSREHFLTLALRLHKKGWPLQCWPAGPSSSSLPPSWSPSLSPSIETLLSWLR